MKKFCFLLATLLCLWSVVQGVAGVYIGGQRFSTSRFEESVTLTSGSATLPVGTYEIRVEFAAAQDYANSRILISDILPTPASNHKHFIRGDGGNEIAFTMGYNTTSRQLRVATAHQTPNKNATLTFKAIGER